ncbi:hypothetical protein K505DRAFT_288926 [Melanomma pulvis-pyrius CBS 109.77]|uniref:Uncharacterized protein n=1 Tax=Melanomma pulvis-pyrius CBS 109.77 TaxID=1314802 RepID=A0A6A6WSI9_9PLEO|nr:hypothetical protein K505DRAFT_288926 [Melanomma pulvis-pyrius CBS 109.77]
MDRALQPSSPTSTGTSASQTSSTYPVFPNPDFVSRFLTVSSAESGITNLDTDLYNRCYLPSNPLPYHQSSNSTSPANQRRDESWIYITIENPNYQIEEAPCKRQAAINTNCYFQNTNGSATGLQKYTDHFDAQQHCFCEKYPFFDAVLGCQRCFEMHGGIEAFHWFPESYVSTFANAYCGTDPPTKEFYSFVSEWKASAAEAKVPSTTAADVLGTQTAASLYYTASPAAASKKPSSASRPSNKLKREIAMLWLSGIGLCTASI